MNAEQLKSPTRTGVGGAKSTILDCLVYRFVLETKPHQNSTTKIGGIGSCLLIKLRSMHGKLNYPPTNETESAVSSGHWCGVYVTSIRHGGRYIRMHVSQPGTVESARPTLIVNAHPPRAVGLRNVSSIRHRLLILESALTIERLSSLTWRGWGDGHTMLIG